MHPGRLLRWISLLGLLAVAAGYFAFCVADPEQRDLDATVRSLVPGSFVRLSDGFTHYELAGPERGEIVVLASDATVPYYLWYPTFRALVDSGFRVLRYDYYGRGYSDRPDLRYDEQTYVRQLAELLDSLLIVEPVDLAGISFGGSVITSFAFRYPDRVRRLVYVDPAISHPRSVPVALRIPLIRDVRGLLAERALPGRQFRDFLHPERMATWTVRYRPQLQYRGFRRARIAEMLAYAGLDQQSELDWLGRSARPVLVVWGKQDSVVPISRSAQLRAAFPQGRFVAVDSAGHLPQWENPGVILPALLAFLRE